MPSIRLNTPTLCGEHLLPPPLLSLSASCSLIPLPSRCCITSRIARRPNATRVGMSPLILARGDSRRYYRREHRARARARAMSITARNHIRRRAANAIRMKYEIPSAKIFTTLRIRRVEARPLAENVERISPRGLVVVKRFGARISVLIIARSLRFVQHIPLLSFSYLFPYLSVFISFSFSPVSLAYPVPLYPSFSLDRSLCLASHSGYSLSLFLPFAARIVPRLSAPYSLIINA